MRKETDLGGVKAIAKALLMTAVNETPYSPMIVQHPFTSTGLIPFPTEMNKGFQPVDITLNEDNLKIWRESVSQIIDESKNPYHIYMLLNPPYALTFLKLASPHLARKDFSEILASAWINCEAPHNDPDLSKSDLLSMFKSAIPKRLWRTMNMNSYDYNTIQTIVNSKAKKNNLKSTDEIAREVIRGLWCNGQDRVKKLKAAGYNPKVIQDRVNELV